MRTVAPGIAAPEESLTSPTTDPYSTCAAALPGTAHMKTTSARATSASNEHRRPTEDIATPPVRSARCYGLRRTESIDAVLSLSLDSSGHRRCQIQILAVAAGR